MELLKALQEKERGYLETLLSDPIKRLQEHSEIELTENEIAEALIKAKSAKILRLEQESSIEQRRKTANEIFKPFTPQELIDYSKKFYWMRCQQHFEIDENNKLLVEKLSRYFTCQEDETYSLKKGILIMGNVGTGKTEIMKFFQKNKKNCYTIFSCNDVADNYLTLKNELEAVYSNAIEKPLQDPAFFFQKHIGICFDDLGTEENKNAFGNKKNVMADVIISIYNKKNYSIFHATTNLNKDEIEERYGTRVASRLREMFNVFVLNGSDRRK